MLSWEGYNSRLFEVLMMVKSLRSKGPSTFCNAILVSELIAQILPFSSFMLSEEEEEQKRQEFRLRTCAGKQPAEQTPTQLGRIFLFLQHVLQTSAFELRLRVDGE